MILSSDPDLQPPFLSWGFRPFFLMAGFYAVVVMAAWLSWLITGRIVGSPDFSQLAIAPQAWHAHEMIFGYAAAVLSGFMLTAVPNWTGARRIAGGPLLLLAAVWFAGRLAMWFAAVLPPLMVATVDLIHLPLLAAFVAAGLFVRPAPRNIIFLGFISLLALANLAFHAEAVQLVSKTATPALMSALVLLSLMVAVIGGRIVPSFTRNVLIRHSTDPSRLPRSFPALDRVSLVSIALVVPLAAFGTTGWPIAVMAGIAAVSNAARLSFWRGADTLGSPILWSLHVSYALLVAGFAALGVASLVEWLPLSSAIHLVGIGGIGGMTLAVMTRAALGHTGRPLRVSTPLALAYAMVAVAAVVRACGPVLAPSHYEATLLVAGLLWISAFAIFALRYAPILVGPSCKPAPGAQP
ncbi:MAG: NnrS family protein [Hyphomicrobiales bacterium]